MSEDVLGSSQMDEEIQEAISDEEEESPSTELADTFSDAFTDRDVETGRHSVSLGSSDQLDDCSFTLIGSLYDVNRTGVEHVARFICAKFCSKTALYHR